MQDTKIIRLGNGYSTIIDSEDYDLIKKYQWTWTSRENTCYAVTVNTPFKIRVWMQRLLMDFPVGKVVHHKNDNGLDNRRENLEVLTRSEHTKITLTGRKYKGCSSRYRGVYKSRYVWIAWIFISGKRIHLGCFNNEEKAYQARLLGERKYGVSNAQ